MIDPSIRKRWETAAAGKTEEIASAALRFADLLQLMADLRGPNGCPWDREQSLASLRQYVLEEAGEVCRAVDAILEREAQLRAQAGLAPAAPEPPEDEDKARTPTKGLSIAHHPHRADFLATASAAGAQLPPALSPAVAAELDGLYGHLVEELGDLLLQSAFMGDILWGMGRPGVDAMLEAILTKLIRRHPHVYGDYVAHDSAAVLKNWERIKQAEREGTG
jgi:NTP pyrophosphatase (non-canonical NTP hydrolase)